MVREASPGLWLLVLSRLPRHRLRAQHAVSHTTSGLLPMAAGCMQGGGETGRGWSSPVDLSRVDEGLHRLADVRALHLLCMAGGCRAAEGS